MRLHVLPTKKPPKHLTLSLYFPHKASVLFLVRWQYLGRVQVHSRWVFTWWSRAASLCLNRLSCRVCLSLSLWRPGEEPSAKADTAYWCVINLLQIIWTQRAGKSIFFLQYSEMECGEPLAAFKPYGNVPSMLTAIFLFHLFFSQTRCLEAGKRLC